MQVKAPRDSVEKVPDTQAHPRLQVHQVQGPQQKLVKLMQDDGFAFIISTDTVAPFIGTSNVTLHYAQDLPKFTDWLKTYFFKANAAWQLKHRTLNYFEDQLGQ